MLNLCMTVTQINGGACTTPHGDALQCHAMGWGGKQSWSVRTDGGPTSKRYVASVCAQVIQSLSSSVRSYALVRRQGDDSIGW